MARADTESRGSQFWTELDQTVNPRTLSPRGRRRLAGGVLQTMMLGFLCAGVAWGSWEIVRTLSTDTSVISGAAQSKPLREIVLITDGVLTQEWLEKTLAVRKGTPLMELDLFRLRERLLAYGQVQAADLERDFPDTLAVTIRERQPVVQVKVQIGDEPPRTLIVARDGVIYEGYGYDPERIAQLPFLDGVRLARRSRGGFLPVDGMEDVANLTQAVQNAAPHLYGDWHVISLNRLYAYDEISVRTRTIPEVVFSRKDDYTRQLARLDYILSYSRRQMGAALHRVDLSLGDQVPVSLDLDHSLSHPSPKTTNPRTRRDL